MTQLRKDPGAASNYFDILFKGVGHRGSSFMDLDRVDYHVAHDGGTGRALVMELKNPSEKTNRGQWRTLQGLIRISPKIEAWALRRRADDRIDFFDIRRSVAIEIIAPAQCRQRYELWWNPQTAIMPTCKHKPEFKENGRCRVCAAMGLTG